MFQTGKTAQVEREMLLYRIDILGISECRWTGNGSVTTSLGNTIIYSGRKDNDHRQGVAIMMSKAAKRSMIEWTPINERLMVARFKSRYTKLSVIQCYAPTNDAEEETKDTFYQQLQKAIDNVRSHDVLLVIGDLNAKVGCSNEGREKIMGEKGCGDMNENGERLADICGLNDLVIGGTIFEHKEIHKLTWMAEHFREVLNRPDPAERACIAQPLGEKLNIDCSPPTKNEILKATKSLKNNKAPGIDNITAEVLKTDIRFATDWLYDLFHKIWNAETIPEEWCRGLIVKLPKKGDRTQCTNWRGVTLLSVPSKIFCKIIHMRLSDAIDTILRKEQAGFRPGVGCIDHIFTLRNIFEQCIEWNTKVHVNFIDLEKAFDSIHRDTLWNILLAYGCPEKIVSIIKLFYNNFTCSVIHKKKVTDWFSVGSGVRQGCVLSPMLFLVAIDWIMRKTIGNKRRGIRWTLMSLLEDLDFADDLALVSSTRDQLQRKTSDLSVTAKQLGLNISRKKTKTMQLTDTPLPVELENEDLEEVEEFTYLGSVMSKSNATVKDITNRLQKAKSSFVQLNKVWRSPNISEKTKIKIYNSSVLSVLL